jgi:plasmid stabilization system protein ParE
MALDIKWSKQAIDDFTNVQGYLLEYYGEASVKKFTRKVFDFLDLLAEYPSIGTMENSSLYIRGFVIVKQLTLFYQVRDHQIILLKFHDNRQDPTVGNYE